MIVMTRLARLAFSVQSVGADCSCAAHPYSAMQLPCSGRGNAHVLLSDGALPHLIGPPRLRMATSMCTTCLQCHCLRRGGVGRGRKCSVEQEDLSTTPLLRTSRTWPAGCRGATAVHSVAFPLQTVWNWITDPSLSSRCRLSRSSNRLTASMATLPSTRVLHSDQRCFAAACACGAAGGLTRSYCFRPSGAAAKAMQTALTLIHLSALVHEQCSPHQHQCRRRHNDSLHLRPSSLSWISDLGSSLPAWIRSTSTCSRRCAITARTAPCMADAAVYCVGIESASTTAAGNTPCRLL